MRFPLYYSVFGFSAFLLVCQAALLGIDYGQQFTKACLLAPGVPFEIVLTADSKRKDLSGLSFKDAPGSGGIERYYGNSAANLMTRFPTQSPFFFKSLLGSSLDLELPTLKRYLELAPGMSLIPSTNNRSTISFSILDDSYPVEEILGMNILDIKNRAKEMLSGTSEHSRLKGLVVTVPPFFNIHQRQALEDAIELSGIPLVSLIDSGSAVMTNFASGRQFSEIPTYFLVYDMGAGSTTATLVSVKEENSSVCIDVEGIGYDDELGGLYYTEIIKNKLIEMLLTQNPAIKRSLLLKDFRAMNKLWKEAERVKTIISANTEVTSRIESVYEDIDFRSHLSRSSFETEMSNEVARVTDPVFAALKRDLVKREALDWKDLEGIIFMGGSTRIPFVQKTIQDAFKDKVLKFVNTDEAGVMGATLRGVGISKMFKSKNITVVDRSLWDYNATFSLNSSQPVNIFTRGAPVNSISSISLPVSELQDFNLIVSENGEDFAKYSIGQVSKAINDLNPKQHKDGNTLSVNATFQLTHSHLIKLLDIWVEIHPQSSLESSISAFSTDSSNSEDIESLKVIPSPTVKKSLVAKVKYLGARPMGAASKEYSRSRINELERVDRERKLKETVRNELEATLYRLKEVASSSELGDTSPDDTESNELLTTINESLDWLDFEGFQASTKELKQKLLEAKKLLADHTPIQQIKVTEEHEKMLKDCTDRIALLKNRLSKFPEEDTKNPTLEITMNDDSNPNMDTVSIKKQILEIIMNKISEKKELETLLEKSSRLSDSILNSLSEDGYNIDDHLNALQKLVKQSERLESQVTIKLKEGLAAFQNSLPKAKTAKGMDKDEL